MRITGCACRQFFSFLVSFFSIILLIYYFLFSSPLLLGGRHLFRMAPTFPAFLLLGPRQRIICRFFCLLVVFWLSIPTVPTKSPNLSQVITHQGENWSRSVRNGLKSLIVSSRVRWKVYCWHREELRPLIRSRSHDFEQVHNLPNLQVPA